MSVAQGYLGTGKGGRRPANLLDACLFWDRCQGGTIHQFADRLKWERASGPCVRGMGSVPVWHLLLDWRAIGWQQCPRKELPAIDATLSANCLDELPDVATWFE